MEHENRGWTTTPYTLYRDGKETLTGTERECFQYILNHHSYSVDHALKYEGYSLKRIATL